ncbi:unnamed protein product [Brassica rapa]|uniref:Uncharacterized protein n=2 Tax=Brassica TaxID=3705 RepID=A0A8D9GWI8_BRACM|nr:unnamed protein product [Brassica napus]CAG7888375.1 unnamed protein product [Brassica rapa]
MVSELIRCSVDKKKRCSHESHQLYSLIYDMAIFIFRRLCFPGVLVNSLALYISLCSMV